MEKTPLTFSGVLRAMILINIRRKNLFRFSFLLALVYILNYMIYFMNPTHFKATGNEIYWQKVYYSRLTFDQLLEKVEKAAIFDKIAINDNKITGELKPLDFRFGVAKRIAISLHNKAFNNTGFVTIDAQKGKYIVTCTKMVLVNQSNTIPAEQRAPVNLEKYALENGTNRLKKSFEKRTGKELDYTYTNMFSFR